MMLFPIESTVRFFACCVLLVLATSPSSHAQDQEKEKPNIILLNLDDADTEIFSQINLETRFPAIRSIANRGLTLTNCHATTPLCGPSRACLLRAQYAHNCKIRVNQKDLPIAYGFDGGFKSYMDRGYFNDDLSTWMQDAGYRTMMVGKFLHANFVPHVPKGWDDFRSYRGGRYYSVSILTNEDHPEGRNRRTLPDVFRVDAEATDAVDVINKHVSRKSGKPFFLFLNTFGPHEPQDRDGLMTNVEKYSNLWPHVTQPASPSYDEENVSDGNGPMRELPKLTEKAHDQIEVLHRKRMVCVRSVDDMVGKLLRTLDRHGLTDNTYIFITSDNGFCLGHHRAIAKGMPLNRASNVPLIVAGPNVAQDISADHLLAHIDIGPTIVDLAGGRTPNFVDGSSFSSLLENPNARPHDHVRNRVLIENYQAKGFIDRELDVASTSLRFQNSQYTEWAAGGRDYFYLGNDPYQIDNLYNTFTSQQRKTFAKTIRGTKTPIQPHVKFRNPFIDGGIVALPIQLKGIAEASGSINRVQLAIQNLDTGEFWDGEDWQTQFSGVLGKLGNPNSQLTIWTYDFNPPQQEGSSDRYRVWGWGIGASGDFAPPTSLSFQACQPDLAVTVPDEGQVLNSEVTLAGQGPCLQRNRFWLLIRNRDDNTYWDGSEFVSVSRSTLIPVNDNDRWSYKISLKPGNYTTTAIANDKSGNRLPLVMRNFKVE